MENKQTDNGKLPDRGEAWGQVVLNLQDAFLSKLKKKPRIFISYPWVTTKGDYPDDKVFGPYTFILKDELPTNELKWGELYLTSSGDYCVLKDGKRVCGVIQKDFLEDIKTKIDDPSFREKILKITTKAGHTRPTIDVSKCDIQTTVKEFKSYLDDVFGINDDEPKENYVHMDVFNNDHGGKRLKKQIKKKIKTYEIVICFLTPLYKAKIEDQRPDGEDYVLKFEYKMINKRKTKTQKTFRFVMAGDIQSAAPREWWTGGLDDSIITDQGIKNNKLLQLQFILRKLLVNPKLSTKKGDHRFDNCWLALDTNGRSATTSYGQINASLTANGPSVIPAMTQDANFKSGDVKGKSFNVVTKGKNNATTETGDIETTGEITIVTVAGYNGEMSEEASRFSKK